MHEAARAWNRSDGTARLWAGDATLHDVVTGLISDLRPDMGISGGACVAGGDNLAVDNVADGRVIGGPAQDGYWYLVRGQNGCPLVPTGTYGDDSFTTARDAVGTDCP